MDCMKAKRPHGPRERQGPRMYEMQGPCPVFRHRLPIAQLPGPGRRLLGYPCRAADCPAACDYLTSHWYQVPARSSGCPALPACPELPPAWFPSPAVTYFYRPRRVPHKGLRAAISRFFDCPQGIHSDGLVVPRSSHFSTGPSTPFPTGSRASWQINPAAGWPVRWLGRSAG
jgi:hypothetical protein